MNMLFRWVRILWRALIQSPRANGDVFSSRYRVGLHDLGWRDHMSNYRFLSFMELGAYHFFFGTRLCFKQHYTRRMISAQQVVYLKPLRPLQAFRQDTKLLGWDEKYFYFRHDFYKDEQLMAVGLVKEACLKQMKVVPPKDILGEDNLKHPVIDSWLANQADIRAMFPQ